jgi:DNA polymerase-3 subunit alpha
MPDESSFVHLHVHTEYSLLDGAARVAPMMDEAVRLGMPAIAMTDHGNLLGAYDFVKAARAAGIKPIVGMEAYGMPGKGSRTNKAPVLFGQGGPDDVSAKGAYTHMTLLATTTQAVHGLMKMSSHAFLDGVFRKPRVDRELLSQHGKGIIGTTGCPSGEVQTYLRLGKYKEALAAAADFRDIFDDGHFFVELMDHGLDIERRTREDLLRLAKDLNLPLLATNDSHYVKREDAKTQEHLLCINSQSTMDIPAGDGPGERFAFSGDGYYLKSAEEMREVFRELPEACNNTLLVAEMTSYDDTLFAPRNLMPRFASPRGLTEAEEFEKQVWDGMAYRYPNGIPEDRRKQAEFEIGVINSMGFPGYFLVVADFINWAKEQGIRVGPGRGSGAGSIAAYAMRITDLDPIVHGLIFERFLNPDRVSMPDFDIDFDELRRGEVIEYVTEKYGSTHVAQIVTLGRIKSKQAVKDSSRIYGFPFAFGDRLTKMMPQPVMGKMPKLPEMFDSSHKRFSEAAEFRAACANDPDVKKVVDVAMGIEGLIRSTGIHAAGVIMSAEPLADVIPVMKPKEDGGIVTQWEYPTCEDLGMVKMDFLGLSNLTTIDEALKNIKRNRGVDVDLTVLDKTLNDPKTFELLARGDTLGVFQLDGGPMRALLKSMKPDNFEDISAVLALYRPGPMGVNAHNDYADRKNGRKPVTPIHKELKDALKDILGDTYGLIVYQEQVMAIAQQLAGYTLGGADLLRRAMGKKKKEELDKQFVTFESGMQANGFSSEAIQALWDTLLPFADYAFNKAHSAAYGVISYYTAYLKANYPAEYMAALLTTNQDDKTKTAIYLNECRKMGIRVLSPDVNTSVAPYAAVGEDVRVGMVAIRNVGHGVVSGIVNARTQHGEFKSFPDFLDKIEIGALNKRAIESLIKAGAFDTLGHKRRALDLIHQQAVDSVASLKKHEAAGQDSLFGAFEDAADAGGTSVDVPDHISEWEKRTLLSFEKDMLGLYVSDHPLNGVGDLLRAKTDFSIGSLIESGTRQVGKMITVGGLITEFERKTTKKGDMFGVFALEDLDGSMEVMAFPNCYSAHSEILANDAFVLVRAKVEKNDDDSLKLFADTIRVLDVNQAALPDPIVLSTTESRLTNDLVSELLDAVGRHKGKKPLHLQVVGPESTKVWALDGSYLVDMSPSFVADMKILFGPNCFTGATSQPRPF